MTSDSFLDMEDAAKFYEKKRELALSTARDDDPDSDEEVFKDLRITESMYHFSCSVTEDDNLYNLYDLYDLRLLQTDAR